MQTLITFFNIVTGDRIETVADGSLSTSEAKALAPAPTYVMLSMIVREPQPPAFAVLGAAEALALLEKEIES